MGLKKIKKHQIRLKSWENRKWSQSSPRLSVNKQRIFSNNISSRTSHDAKEDKGDGSQQKRQQNKDSDMHVLRISLLKLININSRFIPIYKDLSLFVQL